MAQTIIGTFDDQAEAGRAIQALLENGFSSAEISVSKRDLSDARSTTDDYYTGSSKDSNDVITDTISDIFSSLTGNETETDNHVATPQRSNVVVTVRAETPEVTRRVKGILSEYRAFLQKLDDQ